MYRTVAQREAQFEAEMARYLPEDNSGFVGGFLSGHNSVGSWFTSGLSGILASKAASDNNQRKWYIQRNGIQFGKNELDKAIKEYEELAKHRKLTELESADYKEMVERNTALTRDLQHVFDTQGGDLDAAIDKDGKSFNQRWGVNTEDEAALGALIELFKQNPSYVGGVFTAEIIKDLPITLLALLASVPTGGSSGAAQGSRIVATTLNKLNNIQPAALRGLAKVGTGVASGSAVGAGYEAAYSKLNQGSVKGNQVKAGAAFGAGFGILAGLGILGRTNKDLKAKQAQQAQVKRGLSGGDRIDYKSMVQKAQEETPVTPVTKDFASEAVDALYPSEEINKVKKAAHIIYTEHNTRIFPELKDGVEYKVVTLAQAKSLKLPNIRDDLPVQSIVKDNVSHIVWQEGKISNEFKGFYKNYEQILGDSFKDITPRQHLFLRDENSYRSYLMAAELAKVKQRLMPEPQARTADEAINIKENEANNMALNELERAYEQVEMENMSVSDRQVDELIEELKATRTAPDDIEVNTTPSIVNRSMTWLESNPRKKLGIAAGLAGGAYAVADKDEEEPFQQALAVGLGVALGPKGYKLLKGKTINTTTARIKAQIAEGLEIDAEQAKVWETQAQVIVSQLDNFTDAQVRTIINSIEGVDSASLNMTSDMRKTRNEIKQLLDEIGKQAVDSGLIANKDGVMKLSMKGMDSSSRGAFLNNYFPHLFRNMDKLTDDDLTVILGKLNDGSATKRNIEGTLADIQDMIDSGRLTTGLQLLSPKEAINVYIQGMSRAIIGRNALNSMEKMDLGFAPNRNDIALPALLKDADFQMLKDAGKLSDQEITHYRTFEHPALKGYVAHNNIHHVLDDFFAIRHRGNIGEMGEKVLKLNNALKRVFVFGSLFHAQALVMSSVYSLGLAGAIKGTFKIGPKDIITKANERKGSRTITWTDMQLGETQFIDLAKEAIADGLQIVNIKKQELVNPGKAQIDAVLPYLGRGGEIMMKGFNKIDNITWEYLHDRMKLAVYLKQKERMLDAGVEPKLAGQKASEFANDAFGSLDWNNFSTRLYAYAAKHPERVRSKVANRLAQLVPVNKRRWLNLGLFAPDWTVSNIRILYRTLTGLPPMSKAVAHRIHKGDWESPEAKAAVQAWNAYATYAWKAGLYTSAMWWTIMKLFSDNEPTVEGWWDFWTGENSGRLDLGNGETMVISKQIAEPIHWAQHPMHTFMNKTSVVPKTGLELMFNKQWFSLKQGMPLGPRLVDEDGTQHYAKWILGKTVPIVGKSVLDEDLDWQERFERVFTGFFGFPQYGDPEDNRR